MLYIMRHGKTDWNALYKLQGRVDIPLNEEGRVMARSAAQTCRDIPLDICYVSPLQRARETAELLLQGRNIPIVVDERLIEMSFGECEGLDHILRRPDCAVYNLFKDPEHYQAVNGAESFEELYARTGEFVEEVIEPGLAQGQNILIIGHGAMNCSIINRYKNIPLSNFWECGHKNCQLIRLV